MARRAISREHQPVDDRWLSADEIALFLRTKRDTVYKRIARKRAFAQGRPLVEVL